VHNDAVHGLRRVRCAQRAQEAPGRESGRDHQGRQVPPHGGRVPWLLLQCPDDADCGKELKKTKIYTYKNNFKGALADSATAPDDADCVDTTKE